MLRCAVTASSRYEKARNLRAFPAIPCSSPTTWIRSRLFGGGGSLPLNRLRLFPDTGKSTGNSNALLANSLQPIAASPGIYRQISNRPHEGRSNIRELSGNSKSGEHVQLIQTIAFSVALDRQAVHPDRARSNRLRVESHLQRTVQHSSGGAICEFAFDKKAGTILLIN